MKIVGEIGVGVHIGLKGQQLPAQGNALGCMMQGEARPVRAKAFALSARKKKHLHKNPGRCPGLLAAAPMGRRWVFVVVRADTGVCPYGWMSTTLGANLLNVRSTLPAALLLYTPKALNSALRAVTHSARSSNRQRLGSRGHPSSRRNLLSAD